MDSGRYEPPTPDILAQAKAKTASGATLTPAESSALLNSGVTSSELNMMRQASRKAAPQTPTSKFAPPKVDPFVDILKPSPKIASSPPALPPSQQGYSIQPHAATRAEAEYLSRLQQQDMLASRMYGPTSTRLWDEADKADAAAKAAEDRPDAITAATPATVAPIPAPKVTKAPTVDIKPAPAPVVEKGPVSTAVEEKTGLDLSKPVAPEQAKQAVDSFAQFLSENPDGLTLANILDAVGVSLSAYGGVQRETQLQQRKKAQMQLAQQKSMAAQEQANALALRARDLDNQLALIPAEIEKAKAEGNINLANALAVKQAEYENEKRLITPRMQAAIAEARAVAGVKESTAGGGITSRAKGWLE